MTCTCKEQTGGRCLNCQEVYEKKIMKTNDEIHWVCDPCGYTANYLTCLKQYGQPPKQKKSTVSTYHQNDCHVCGEYTSVTESRDFYYPDFQLILKKIKK